MPLSQSRCLHMQLWPRCSATDVCGSNQVPTFLRKPNGIPTYLVGRWRDLLVYYWMSTHGGGRHTTVLTLPPISKIGGSKDVTDSMGSTP